MEKKMKRWILLLCIVPIFLISCLTGSSERKKDECPSGVPRSGMQKWIKKNEINESIGRVRFPGLHEVVRRASG
jgi:hypothetical protein